MPTRHPFIISLAALSMLAAPLGAAGDTSGSSHGPLFERNISGTLDLASSKAKIDGLQFYVPSRNAAGERVEVIFTDAQGTIVETRGEARPLISVYVDDDQDPALGDDVWAAYSLDDGDTWQRDNLSVSAGRSSYEIDGVPYPGSVSKPMLTLKGNRLLVAWTSTYCGSGFPAYADRTDSDLYGVADPQGSVDYTDQGYSEVGEVPYKCVWTARGLVDTSDGDITWYQPERLTSGARYAMQLTSTSASNAGFVLAWGEDPEGLAPGEASGPGEGWTGASPHPGTDVWYAYLLMSAFNGVDAEPAPDPDDPAILTERPRPAQKISLPVPVSDNARLSEGDPVPVVGATRPAVGIAPSSAGAWVAYGYEETKDGPELAVDAEVGKRVFHHAFAYDAPDVFSAGALVSRPAQSARRVRYISQPMTGLGPSRTVGLLLYRMGTDGHSAAADFLIHRFVVPERDTAADNPFRTGTMTAATNLSATTELQRLTDAGARPRVTRWIQTAENLDDATSASPLESARGHRGMIKGDFLALGYLWTPNWELYLQGRDIENYYVRRSFDGGQTFTTSPREAPYGGDGNTSCRYFNHPVTGALLPPLCRVLGPGEFEPAQNLSRLDGFDETAIEPRLPGVPGSIPPSAGSGTEPGVPYPEDVQDVSVVWHAWGTGSPQVPAAGDNEFSPADADVPIPGQDPGKGPLDIYCTFSRDYGDTYVENEPLADGPSAEAEVQLRLSPDGSKVYAAWNSLGSPDDLSEFLDVFFRRLSPDSFPNNTTPGRLQMVDELAFAAEGDPAIVSVERVVGSRDPVRVRYTTRDATGVAGRDYEPVTGTLEFGHGDLGPKTIEIATVENRELEAHRRFRVVLTAASGGAMLGQPVVTRVQVRDDDDRRSPRSRATSPSVQRGPLIHVRYRATDAETAVRWVALYVMKPGEAVFSRRQVDRAAVLDGAFTVNSEGVNGRYRIYTVAADVRGNVEPPPALRDTVTVVDSKSPVITRTSAVPERYELGSREGVRLRMHTSEPGRVTFLVKETGIVVRSFAPARTQRGLVTRTWWGRNDVGRFVLPSLHTVVMSAEDLAGNTTTTRVRLRVVDERR